MSVLGPVSAFLSSCTWAVGTSVYARVSASAPVTAVIATRAVVAAPVLVLAAVAVHGAAALVQVPATQLAYLALATLASYGLGDVLFLASARRLGVPGALAIGSTFPLWAALSGIVLLGEPAGPARLGGVVAVVLGTIVVIVSGARHPTAARGPAFAAGVLLALATSALWALNSVCVRVGAAGVAPLVSSAWRLVFGLAICPAVGWLARGRSPWQPYVPWPRLRPALWAFLLESAGGTFLFVYGTSRSPLALGAPLTSLAPVLSLPVAWATRAEPPSPAKAAGVALVTMGIALLLA